MARNQSSFHTDDTETARKIQMAPCLYRVRWAERRFVFVVNKKNIDPAMGGAMLLRTKPSAFSVFIRVIRVKTNLLSVPMSQP